MPLPLFEAQINRPYYVIDSTFFTTVANTNYYTLYTFGNIGNQVECEAEIATFDSIKMTPLTTGTIATYTFVIQLENSILNDGYINIVLPAGFTYTTTGSSPCALSSSSNSVKSSGTCTIVSP